MEEFYTELWKQQLHKCSGNQFKTEPVKSGAITLKA